jgi:dTDP-4-dehydrorhamnose reductase
VQPVRRKTLILGGSSFLGRRLSAQLGADQAVATFNQQPLDGGLHFDALNTDLADVVGNPDEYSHAVVLLGEAKPDACVRFPEQSYQLNVVRTRLIIDQLVDWGIVPVFASTESVFDGRKGRYVEEDAANPILAYGRQKLAIEEYIQKMCSRYVIVRLARLFSLSTRDGTLLTALLSEISLNRPLRVAADQVLSPIEVDDAAATMLGLMDLGCSGTFHIASEDAMSRAQILHTLLGEYRRYREYTGVVSICSITAFPSLEPRPLDTSHNPSKVIAAPGRRPRGVASCCEAAVKAWLDTPC